MRMPTAIMARKKSVAAEVKPTMSTGATADSTPSARLDHTTRGFRPSSSEMRPARGEARTLADPPMAKSSAML